VLLADDHAPLLQEASNLLRPHFETLGTTQDGGTLVLEALRLHPDIVVTDIKMPVLSGIEVARKLRESGSSARLVILTVHREEEMVKACMAEGALGYVLKSAIRADLIPAIRAALLGHRYISPSLSAEL
jgi:DNA-binding NarL/FixJ family response regulator